MGQEMLGKRPNQFGRDTPESPFAVTTAKYILDPLADDLPPTQSLRLWMPTAQVCRIAGAKVFLTSAGA